MRRKLLKHNHSKQLNLAVMVMLLLGSNCAGLHIQAEEAEAMSFKMEGVTVEAKRPDWESKLSPGTVTIIRPDDYEGEQKTLPDLLKEVPGVHVREVNGKGQYTTLTIRGSTAAQVGVFVDGVLTNLGGDAAVDISTIPIQNVERVEVYRGYTPVRFGGTYMGGVVNIVTKRPDKAKTQVEFGKRSYGGTVYGVQFNAPVGNGTLMVGINRDESDGDFKYTNYANDIAKRVEQGLYDSLSNKIVTFNESNINDMNSRYGMDLTESEMNNFKSDRQAWHDFLTDKTPGSRNFTNLHSEVLRNTVDMTQHSQEVWRYVQTLGEYKGKWANYDEFMGDKNGWRKVIRKKTIREGARDEIYMKETVPPIIEGYIERLDPDNPKSTVKTYEADLEKSKEKLDKLGDGERKRRYNDYENTDAIIKWQNDNWMIKGAWKRIDRHLPDGVWYGPALNISSAIMGPFADATDLYLAEGRHQKQDNKELLIGHRQQNGKLEWGVSVDY